MKIIIIILCLSLNAAAFSQETQFPLRAQYPDVPVVERATLYDHYTNDSAIIVDVRSGYEFNVLRIKNAQHISVTNQGFIPSLKKLRQESSLPIIFYCNGITCAKSYKASKKALEGGISNVFTFDLGIFGWTKAYPDAAELLGESPVPQDKLIRKADLEARMLPPAEFEAKLKRTSSKEMLVLDLREPFQRKDKILETYTRAITTSRIDAALKLAKVNNKTLFIYDAVGKQVRWVQYAIEKSGYNDYYFMKGGVKAYMGKI